jgi:hypothetical protein
VYNKEQKVTSMQQFLPQKSAYLKAL